MTHKCSTTRKKRSVVWKLPDEKFIELIKNSKRMKDVLLFFGISNKGGNYNTVNSRIKHLRLSTDHMLKNWESMQFTRNISVEEFKKNKLIANSSTNRGTIKRYVIRFGLLKLQCESCGNTGSWNSKPLTLQLEHKNGISNDNRLENLCLLCPNCHSQTSTYAGKMNCRART